MTYAGKGYAVINLIETICRVCKGIGMGKALDLKCVREMDVCHMNAVEGLRSTLQLHALVARMCTISGLQ